MKELIGIQGGPASYHEAAAVLLHPDAELEYYDTFTNVFDALRDRTVDAVVVAIANNRIGFIPDVFEELTQADSPFTITGETYLGIQHALLGVKGSKLEAVTEVHSQAPAIGQCSRFLETLLPDARVIEEHDTAGSARLVSESGNAHSAAIASLAAGELYGLVTLRKSIQDDPLNITRFLEVRLAGAVVERANKTTITLDTEKGVGALYGILGVFNNAGVTISDLRTQSIPNTNFRKDFFIELEAGLNEQGIQSALEQLESGGCCIRVVGSYKAGTISHLIES